MYREIMYGKRMPLFTIPFSYIINKEKISKKGFSGVIITLIGVLILFIWKNRKKKKLVLSY